MASVTKVIKSSGGDYASLASWEAALSADPTSDQVASIEEAFDAGEVLINVSNANLRRLTITVAAAYRHYAQAGWPDMSSGASTAGRIVSDGTTDTMCIQFATSGRLFVEWLSIVEAQAGSRGYGVYANQGIVYLSNCVIESFPGNAFYGAVLCDGASIYCTRVAVPNSASGGSATTGFRCLAGTLVTINCSASCDNPFTQAGGTASAYGCIAQSGWAGTWGGDKNVSYDTTAPGTTTWKSQTNVFTSSTDLHLQAGKVGSYGVTNYAAASTVTRVQGVDQNGFANISFTGVTAGNFLVITMNGTGASMAASDSAGTVVLLPSTNSGSSSNARLGYVFNAASGTHTISFTGTGGGHAMVEEFSGIPTLFDPLDEHEESYSTSSTTNHTISTLSYYDGLGVVTWTDWSVGTTTTASTGYTQRYNASGDSTSAADNTTLTAGSATPGFTATAASAANAMVFAGFRNATAPWAATDIDGTTVTGTWDAGVDQGSAAPTVNTKPNFFLAST